MYTQCVLALLVLYVGSAHSFSWDIVLDGRNGLEFYSNGTLTYSQDISPFENPEVVYDPVHNRVLYSDNSERPGKIYSFDIETKKIQSLVTCESNGYLKFDYDPVTETLFCTAYTKIYWFSLKPEATNPVDGNLLFDLDSFTNSIAVDSCGGYVYWTVGHTMERARFDGSDREVVRVTHSFPYWRPDLAIDQQTQTIYSIVEHSTSHNYNVTIESLDFNGNIKEKLYDEKTKFYGGSVSVSKDFIYWRGSDSDTLWQLPKNAPHQYPITHEDSCKYCASIATNYKLEDFTHGSRTCDALTNLLPSTAVVTADADLLCVHGTRVIGESVCKCTQGYTGERCDVSICHNFCFQGDCSVSDEQPKCRCNAGYSGQRCEVNACHNYCSNNGTCSLNEENEPVCLCTEDYKGDRCDVPVGQGNSSLCEVDEHKCRFNADNSGGSSKVDACHKHCLNNGVCCLNEESEPVCQCTGDYEGKRCEVSVSAFLIKCSRTVSTLRDILNTD